jgi:RNA polymerase sigma-70 factor (ECF subfamily)
MQSFEGAFQPPSPGPLPANLPELEQLVSTEYRKFTRRASRYLDNFHDAEDAVQDAMLSAYQHLSTFKNQSKLSTWLTTIVINAARAQRRRRKPGLSYEQLLETVESPALITKLSRDNRPGPEEIHGCNEVNHLLLAFVDQLSPIYRRAVYLFYFHGLNTADASDVLGIPVPTFKAQLGRARKQLRQRLDETVDLRSRKAPFDASR